MGDVVAFAVEVKRGKSVAGFAVFDEPTRSVGGSGASQCRIYLLSYCKERKKMGEGSEAVLCCLYTYDSCINGIAIMKIRAGMKDAPREYRQPMASPRSLSQKVMP